MGGAMNMERQPVVDPAHPVDYSKQEVPPSYKCHKCGAAGCKLWRDYQTFLEHQTLLCARCAGEGQGKNVDSIGDDGSYIGECGSTDQIGWFVPAVPTEGNDTFWGYFSVPQDGVEWWKRLPTLPEQVSGGGCGN